MQTGQQILQGIFLQINFPSMRVLELITGHVIFKLRYNQIYQLKTTKDWFVGHSWAAGIFPFADGRNQESSSESVNAWYAVSLYGLAIGNERIKDLGRLALASEIRFYLLINVIPG